MRDFRNGWGRYRDREGVPPDHRTGELRGSGGVSAPVLVQDPQVLGDRSTDGREGFRLVLERRGRSLTRRSLNADVWDITAVSQLVNAGRLNPTKNGKPVVINGLQTRLDCSELALHVISGALATWD